MIRAAKSEDVSKVLPAMLREMHRASKYADCATINEKAMEQVLLSLVAGQNQNGPSATFCRIAEDESGRPVGFMAGALDRIYHIADQLTAGDAYLYVRPSASPRHAWQLIDSYIAWASANPKVAVIKLSWTDAMPGAERIGAVYERKGFNRIGEIFQLRLDRAMRKAA